MIIRIKNKEVIDKAINEIESNILEMEYPKNISGDNWEKEGEKSYNNIRHNIDKEANIYVILTKCYPEECDEYEVRYVGKTNNITTRIKQHTVKCSKGLSSCLEYVKKYILSQNNKKIYISTINVKPVELNSYIETLLLNYFDSDNVWYTRTS